VSRGGKITGILKGRNLKRSRRDSRRYLGRKKNTRISAGVEKKKLGETKKGEKKSNSTSSTQLVAQRDGSGSQAEGIWRKEALSLRWNRKGTVLKEKRFGKSRIDRSISPWDRAGEKKVAEVGGNTKREAKQGVREQGSWGGSK